MPAISAGSAAQFLAHDAIHNLHALVSHVFKSVDTVDGDIAAGSVNIMGSIRFLIDSSP